MLRPPRSTAAVALKRWRSVTTYCDLHGRINPDGSMSSAADYELRAERMLQAALDNLGMSPMARSKLGLNIARTAGAAFDLARQWQEEDEDDA